MNNNLQNRYENDAPWKPTYKGMAIAAGAILIALTIVFFVLNIVLKPYMRELPKELTPWLNKSVKEIKVEQKEEGALNNASDKK